MHDIVSAVCMLSNMSAESAHPFTSVVAHNVKRWRERRGLGQGEFAERLGDLGWSIDRTGVTRIEKGRREITVDDLGVLAVALNVPMTLLLLPAFDNANVAISPNGPTSSVNPWLVYEWMRGEEPLPGRFGFGDEWLDGAYHLARYDDLRTAVIAAREQMKPITRAAADAAAKRATPEQFRDGYAFLDLQFEEQRALDQIDDPALDQRLQEVLDASYALHPTGIRVGDLIPRDVWFEVRRRDLRPSRIATDGAS